MITLKPKRIAQISALTAMALTVHIIEGCIPPLVAVPGVKLGLANSVTLAALYLLYPTDVFLIVVIRVLLGSIFSGRPISFIYSASGGIAAYFVMLAMHKRVKLNKIWAVSVCGAVANSLFQVLAAAVMLKSTSVFYYLFPLTAVSVLCGAFTGIIAQNVVIRMAKFN